MGMLTSLWSIFVCIIFKSDMGFDYVHRMGVCPYINTKNLPKDSTSAFHIHVYIIAEAHMYAHICTYMHIHAHVYAHICTYMHMCMHI